MPGSLDALRDEVYDAVVIGAGINGSSAAQHLAAEGYKVLLVDKGDFGGRTTSHSGRVLHCGLQALSPRDNIREFLKTPSAFLMRLRVARQMALDHAELCRTSVERLRPMDTLVPVYQGAGYRGWHVDIGAKLIQAYGGRGSDIRYRRWSHPNKSPHPFAHHVRDQEKLESLIAFTDQRFHWPERIAIDAALDAQAIGATIRNFVGVNSLSRNSQGLWKLELTDSTLPANTAEVWTRIVINLAGAWVDRVIKGVQTRNNVSRKITAVKGVYVLVKLPSEYHGAGIAGLNRVGEPICCLPWGDFHYIGPTETKFEGDIEHVVPNEDDIQFLIEEFNYLVPGIQISRNDAIMSWAGVRPITYAPDHPKGKRLPFSILHDLDVEGLPGMLTLSWGIIVNHRSTARRIVRAVSSRLPPTRQRTSINYKSYRFPETASPRLQSDHPVTLSDVRHCIDHQHARDLFGILFSRTGLGWTANLKRQSIETTAAVLGESLGWSPASIDQNIANFTQHLRRYYLYELS